MLLTRLLTSRRLCFICFFTAMTSGSTGIHAQSLRDTSLLLMMSRPFFYNVVKDRSGEIKAGTSVGVYRMQGTQMVKINDSSGYLKLDGQGRAVMDPDGVGLHQSADMQHLLPYPTVKRDQYHAGNHHYLYVTSAGTMHIFEMLPYDRSFRNISVRSISDHFTGTYSGIYYGDRLLPFPVSPFTDGYIREYNGKVFMCTHGLDVFEMKSIGSGGVVVRVPLPEEYNFVPCRDIRYLPSSSTYIIASGNRLVVMDSSLKQVRERFFGKEEIVLLNEIAPYSVFVFSAGRQLYHYYLKHDRIDTLSALKEPILDGISKQQINLILTTNGLYIEQSARGFELSVALKKAHTLRGLDDNRFVIATDEGLFLYRLDQQKLETLVPGVEFNRRGLHVKDGKLYAGSVSGLYILDLGQLDEIIAFHNREIMTEGKDAWLWWISAGFILLSGGLLWVIFRYRNRLKHIEAAIQTPAAIPAKPRLSREDIITFINENLTTASIKTISHHFDTNHTMVYTLLAPDKPGDLIQQLRYGTVQRLREEGRTPAEIAAATGLSESYVRRIRRQKDENADSTPDEG
jgi:hypothetical protein